MSLQGLVFHLLTLNVKEKNRVTVIIGENGGKVNFSLAKEVTHVVTTRKEISEGKNPKLKKCHQLGLIVLDVDQFFEFVESRPKVVVTSVADPSTSEQNTQLVNYQPPEELKAYKAPSISLVLPDKGPTSGTFQVAIFGLYFTSSSNFRVKFGDVLASSIEYHCPTAILITVSIPQMKIPPGTIQVSASNDSGRHWGPSTSFQFYDPEATLVPSGTEDENYGVLQGQFSNLKRMIANLHLGMINVQKMEEEIGSKLATPASFHALSAITTTVRTDGSVQTSTISSISGSAPTRGPVQARGPKTVSTTHVDKQNQNLPEVQTKGGEREIRIFISSTFKDMQEERDNLVKRCLPKLKRYCNERDVALSFVDLRWGVTTAQSEGAATFLTILKEIDKCDVFIGILGDRYGWCISQQGLSGHTTSPQDELLKNTFIVASEQGYGWLRNFKDRSVTEVEMRMILQGFADSRARSKAAWFYFRDPYYVKENIIDAEKANFVSEGPYEATKLNQLKADIQNSSFPSQQYNRPSHLLDLIYEDLQQFVNRKFPEKSVLSEEESERFRHNSYASSLCRVYMPLDKMFMALDKYASSNTETPLIIFGEGGTGKSALLANWLQRYRDQHPEVVLVSHFVGCSSASTNYHSLLYRLMWEIQDLLNDKTLDIPKTNVSENLPQWLERTLVRNHRTKMILVIDGLDGIDERENAKDLLWLPRTFPACIRVVLSCASQKLREITKRRKYQEQVMDRLDEAEISQFINLYLALHSKRLPDTQAFKIAAAPQSRLPRFLKTLLDDLISYGDFENLDAKIVSDLKCASVSNLLEIILKQIENDFDKEKKGIVKHFMSYLFCSRRGLLQTELQYFLDSKGIPSQDQDTLSLILEPFLLSSRGLLTFSNYDIRKAVESRYLSDPKEKKQYHTDIAAYFAKKVEGFRERKVEELPWQYEQAEMWTKLQEIITDFRVFDLLYDDGSNKYDLLRYCRNINSNLSDVKIVAVYEAALARGDTFPSGVILGTLWFRCAKFFEELGEYDASLRTFKRAKAHYESSAQNLDAAHTDYSIGHILLTKGNYPESEEKFLKAKAIYTREKGEDCVEVSIVLNRLGALYSELGRYPEAEEALLTALKIRTGQLGQTDVRVGQVLKTLMIYYDQVQNFPKALEVGQKSLTIIEDNWGHENIQVAYILLRLGRVHMQLGHYSEAKAMYKRSYRIMEAKLGSEHPNIADVIYELGCYYMMKKEDVAKQGKFALDKAEERFLRALKIKKQALGEDHTELAIIYTRLGSLYIERTEFDEAEKSLLLALEMRERKLGPTHSRVAQTCRHLMTLYESQEKFPQAIQMGQRLLTLARGSSASQDYISNLLVRLGSHYEAIEGRESQQMREYWKEALQIRTQLFGADNLKTKEVQELLENADRAPIPLPPPMPAFLLPVQEEVKVKDLEIGGSRRAMLDEIVVKAQNKFKKGVV